MAKKWQDMAPRERARAIELLKWEERWWRKEAATELRRHKAACTRKANLLQAAIEFLKAPEGTTAKEVT